MDLSQFEAKSPFRLFRRPLTAQVASGQLGVIMARAGVGKTACLVQLSLDHLAKGRQTLHLSLGHAVDHIKARYDALVEARVEPSADQTLGLATQAALTPNRMIKTFRDNQLSADRLSQTAQVLRDHLNFRPQVVLIDGFDWSAGNADERRANLEALKAFAQNAGAELWLTAQTHRSHTGDHPTQIPPPCLEAEALIDTAIFLEPNEKSVRLRLLKHGADAGDPEEQVELDSRTLLPLQPQEPRLAAQEERSDYLLLSGGAPGAEAEFGACAEKWGIGEMTFTFDGRVPHRTQGLVQLSDEELSQGDVSSRYIQTHMNRTYPDTPEFRKTLQSIWHQVNTAGEVFAVGVILPDQTVKGGTGWAAELGRRLNKPVHVFDQSRNRWFIWRDPHWAEEEAPVIRCRRFNGTGTKDLSEAGRTAIHALFVRTFGPLP